MHSERDAREKREKRERRDVHSVLSIRLNGRARRARLASLACLALMLPGCMMGPDYNRPETPQADSWRVSPATSESMANLPWWELLKDETLQQLIRTALMENLDLQIATANIDQFQAQLTISKFDLIPSFSYEGTAFGFRNTNTSSFPAGGGASAPIEDGEAESGRAEAARADGVDSGRV